MQTAFEAELRQRQKVGTTVEYRNLCVRTVELVLVRNRPRHDADEFVARVRAHAQKIIRMNGQMASDDGTVQVFEVYAVFGCRDDRWKLKEVVQPATGRRFVADENIDESAVKTISST
jgi:hypothetical protein